MIKKSSIRRKIMGAILFTCMVALLLLCGAYFIFEYVSYRNTEKENLATLGSVVASNSSAALAFESQADANEILSALKGNPHVVAAALYNKNNELFAWYPANLKPAQLPAKPIANGYSFNDGLMDGFEPVYQKTDRLGTLYIRSDLKQMYTQLYNLLLITGLLFASALLIAYLLSVLLQRRISQPILALENTARTVSERHDYSVRAIKTSDDELGSLTDAFNRMLMQIELQNEAIKEAGVETSKLAAIVESSNDPIISMTLDGIITSWNDSAERTFGYRQAEVIGRSILTIIPDDRRDEEESILERLGKGERIEQFETQRLTKNQKLLDISLTVSPLKDEKGNITGSSKILRDITEKKQEERRKNDFIGMVSHELKTPLTSIRSYIQVLLAQAKKDSTDNFRLNALTRADIQTKKMSHMIQDFLNLARLEEEKIQLQQVVFGIKPLIEEITYDAQFLTTSHRLHIETCEDVNVKADREKIGQVLMNLLTNAIKYSPKGGDIEVSCTLANTRVRIQVTDHGVGINPDEQAKLFQRFYRVQNQQVQTVSGFGIGLYLVAQMLKYHNSEIRVESREGEGATFYFELEAAV